MAKLTLVGRLGKAAEIQTFTNGAQLRFSLAEDRRVAKKQADGSFQYTKGVIWYQVSVSGFNTAESAMNMRKFLDKGAMVKVDGELRPTEAGYPRTYTRADGTVAASYDVHCTVSDFHLLAGKEIGAATPAGEAPAEPPVSEDF